jgi:hypothetical protein
VLVVKAVTGDYWLQAMTGLQAAMGILAGFALCRTVATVSGPRILGVAAAIVFTLGERGQFDRWVITDSLSTSLFTLFACRAIWLVHERRQPSAVDLFYFGGTLSLLFLFREVSLVLALGALPLMLLMVWPFGSIAKVLRRLAPMYVPIALTVALFLSWNFMRTGYWVFSVGAIDTPLFALTQIEQAGTPIFNTNSELDSIARKHLKKYDPAETRDIYAEFWQKTKMPPPELAAFIGRKYLEGLKDHPTAVARFARANLQLWPYVFAPNALTDPLTQRNPMDGHFKHFVRLFYICLIFPFIFCLIAVFARSARRGAILIGSIVPLFLPMMLLFAVLHLELRYAVFTTAPLLLMLAVALRWTFRLWRLKVRRAGIETGFLNRKFMRTCAEIDTVRGARQFS